MRTPTPIVEKAGMRFLENLKKNDPGLYREIMNRMPGGLAGLSGIWDNIGSAVGDVLRQAPAIMQNQFEAKQRMKAAEELAENELARANLQIQQQQIQARNLQAQEDILYAQQMLERERANLVAAQNAVFSPTQKMGLAAAGGLTLLLIVMVYNRKKGR